MHNKKEKNSFSSGIFMRMRKILFIIIVFVLGFAAQAADFKFAVLGDSQLHNPDVFESLVREVELLKPDFVVQVGDMIHGYTYEPGQIRGEWARFKTQIAPLSMPFYPVPGNHDVTTSPMEAIYEEVWGRDRFYYSFNHKGSHFIILDTDFRLHYGVVTPEQMDWLSLDLEESRTAEHTFLFMHQPLWRDKQSNWGDLRSLLAKYPRVRVIFAGHTHEYCFEVVDGIKTFIINSSGQINHEAPAVGYFFQALLVSVNGDDLMEAVIPAGSIKPPDYVNRQERTRAGPYFIPPTGGQILDPADKELDYVYSFPLKNRTWEMNVYTVRWVTPNPAFTVEPLEQAVLLAPGRTEDVYVRLKAPSRRFEYYSLPYAFIETYYNTLRGESIILRSRHDLSIPRKAKVRFTSKPPWIDGILDDTAWQSADVITDFQVTKAGDPADVQTWVRTLYDENNFYIGVHCEEPNPEDLVAFASGTIPFTWGDDDVEIFLDVNHDMRTYDRAFVNSAAATFNSMPEKGICKPWYDHAVHIGKDYWAAEFRMPFKDLGFEDTPTSATVWGFNVRRHRQKPERVQSDWQKMQNVPYEPWRFGVLQFVKDHKE